MLQSRRDASRGYKLVLAAAPRLVCLCGGAASFFKGQPAANVEPNSVTAVLQKGYTLSGRLLRPAMVVVASAS